MKRPPSTEEREAGIRALQDSLYGGGPLPERRALSAAGDALPLFAPDMLPAPLEPPPAPQPPVASVLDVVVDTSAPAEVPAPDTETFSLFGHDLFGGPAGPPGGSGALATRFVVPPFTVLDARQGGWQERKRAWLSLGIRSELGRGGGLMGMSEAVSLRFLQGEAAYRAQLDNKDTEADDATEA